MKAPPAGTPPPLEPSSARTARAEARSASTASANEERDLIGDEPFGGMPVPRVPMKEIDRAGSIGRVHRSR
jgi:hypothetical protein